MSKDKKEEIELVWHDQQENILKKWEKLVRHIDLCMIELI